MTVEGDKIREAMASLKAGVNSVAVVTEVNTALMEEHIGDQAGVITVQGNTILTLQAENERLKEALAECEGNTPPDPPASKTGFGACPRTGRNATGEPAKFFGEPSDVRWFGVAITTVPPRPSKQSCPTFFASWKPFTSSRTTPSKAQFLASCKPLLPGDFITWEHEYDVKYLNAVASANKDFTDGKITAVQRDLRIGVAEEDLQERLRLIQVCHEMKEELRPDLFTYPTVAGWRFTVNNGMAKFKAVGDYIGIDYDGVNTSYYNFADPKILARSKEYADANHGGNIVIPEIGWPRQANDSSGKGRVLAIETQVPVIVETLKPRACIWFDSDTFTGYPLTLPNEVEAWKDMYDL